MPLLEPLLGILTWLDRPPVDLVRYIVQLCCQPAITFLNRELQGVIQQSHSRLQLSFIITIIHESIYLRHAGPHLIVEPLVVPLRDHLDKVLPYHRPRVLPELAHCSKQPWDSMLYLCHFLQPLPNSFHCRPGPASHLELRQLGKPLSCLRKHLRLSFSLPQHHLCDLLHRLCDRLCNGQDLTACHTSAQGAATTPGQRPCVIRLSVLHVWHHFLVTSSVFVLSDTHHATMPRVDPHLRVHILGFCTRATQAMFLHGLARLVRYPTRAISASNITSTHTRQRSTFALLDLDIQRVKTVLQGINLTRINTTTHGCSLTISGRVPGPLLAQVSSIVLLRFAPIFRGVNAHLHRHLTCEVRHQYLRVKLLDPAVFDVHSRRHLPHISKGFDPKGVET